MHFFSKKIIIFICVAALTACGGGGGGSSEPTPTPPPAPRPTVNLSAEPLSVLTGNETTLSWTTTNATTCSASGSWSGQKATSGSESATINTTGNNQFSLSCSGPGGSGSASVIVEGYENATGFVVDGYITGAEVFIDQDGNFISDNSDESTQSDSSGNFVIKKTTGDYVSIGGIDFDTQNSLDNLLLWHKNFQEFDPKAITPVTSVASFLQEPAAINDMLGIAADINVFTFDPVANKGDDGPNDFLYEKGNQLTTIALALQNAINEANNSLDTSQNIFLSISNVLSNNFNATGEIVNIESIEFLDSVMTDLENSQSINLSQERRDNIVTALSSILPIIEVKINDSVTTGIFNFATSTLLTDIRLMATGSASEELIDKYKTDMLNYVAEDQNLDPADIVPEIIANDDNYSTDEDTNISFNILANDSFVINSQLNITLGAPSNGSIENDNGVITYSPNENYFGLDEFSYVLEQGGLTDAAAVRIVIDSVNDAPRIQSGPYSIFENTREVGEIRATDTEGQDLTYSIKEGDSDALDLIGNNLSFKEDTNYEERDTYGFVAVVSDGLTETQKFINIFIRDVNEPPTITSESEFTIPENSRAVGQVIATDPDLWPDVLTYSLFRPDAVALSIDDAGFITFNENANYEIKDSYSIQARVADYEFTDTQEILINITDVNDAPVFTTSNQFSINENSVLVGSVLATDEDQDPLVYSVEGNDAAFFDITELADGAGLSISFKTAPNYEVDQQIYNLTVAVADNDTIIEQAITINVLDINEAPTAINTFPTTIEIPENGGIPDTIGATACVDPRYFICSGTINIGGSTTQYQFVDEDGDTIIFGLGGTDANSFSNSQNGSYLIKEYADYEAQSRYEINLVLSDGDLTTNVPLVLAITNVNEAPQITSESFSVDENQTQVGVVEYTDPENDSVNFKIETSIDYPDNGYFEIDQFSGNLTFKNSPDYETKNSYEISIVIQDSAGLFSYGYLTINILDVDESDTNTQYECDVYISNAKTNEFRYCWQESQDNSGTEYSANVNQPISVTFGGLAIEIPEISFAELLYSDYGVILVNDSLAWTNDYAYALYESIKKTPYGIQAEGEDLRSFSSWTLTEDFITDDIQLTDVSDGTNVLISTAAFENANPKIAEVEGKRGIFFSNRLFKAALRYVSNNGSEQNIISQMLLDRYGVSIDIDNYQTLTGEPSTRFQDFQPEELIEIITMFEEMPSGFHKVEGLNYLVRRLNGAVNENYPEAPAIAWVGSGYIEFMEGGFNSNLEEYIHRLILHEKAHFMWGASHNESTDGSGIFDATLKADWIELGGWYECTDRESGWCTTKQTEFVSAYAHSKNPNEDMAESLSYFVVNPDALRSRSIAKYEFIRDRIMQGNIYISQIREDLTFEVYNLFPDYVFPGKIKKIQVSLKGAPNDDKTLTVEVELHALDEVLEGAAEGYMRLYSSADTFIDLRLYPRDGSTISTRLRSSPTTISKFIKNGFWKVNNITLEDQVGNIRNFGANDFGWRLHVNNPLEDIVKPSYVDDSIEFFKTVEVIDNQEVDILNVTWQTVETNPRENQGCYGTVNDEVITTYSIQKYAPFGYEESEYYSANQCYLRYPIPYYMPSGNYSISYAKMFDLANNNGEIYFQPPDGSVNAGWDNPDDVSPVLTFETTNPDVTAPELDLNDLSISAVPTNPEAPNGETVVTFKFKVKDDISGYNLGTFYLRDPQGLLYGFYQYPERRGDLFPSAEDLDWYEYERTVVLPPGSAPGTWGVAELTLQDRALNYKTYNFTEIVSFVVDN